MNRKAELSSRTASCREPSADTIRQALDQQGHHLSDAILTRLEASRHSALARLPSTEARCQAVDLQRQRPDRTPPTRLSDLLMPSPYLLQGLTTACVAMLAFLIFASLSDQGGVPVPAAEPGMPTDSELTLQTASIDPLVKPPAETENSEEATPSLDETHETATPDNLDLVGSVEFLLWLESQQS